jgi:hypothetical protein
MQPTVVDSKTGLPLNDGPNQPFYKALGFKHVVGLTCVALFLAALGHHVNYFLPTIDAGPLSLPGGPIPTIEGMGDWFRKGCPNFFGNLLVGAGVVFSAFTDYELYQEMFTDICDWFEEWREWWTGK